MRELFPLEGIHLKMLQDDFQKKKISLEENSLINILSDPDFNRHWKWSAAIALRKFGTKKCIPQLKELLDYPSEDVVNVSLLTISHIGGKDELNFLTSLLERKGLKKDYVLWSISAISEQEAIIPVVQFMTVKLKNHRRLSVKKLSEFKHGLIYLDKFSSDVSALEILQGYSEIWSKIDLHIQDELKKKTSYYKNILNP